MKTLLFVALAAPLCAHDLFLMPKKFHVAPGESLLISVHNGDAFPESEGPVDPRRICEARLGAAPLSGFRILGKATHALAAAPPAGSHYAVARTEPRYLELPAARFEGYLKEEGLEAIVARRREAGEAAKNGRELYAKYAKALIVSGAPGAGWAQPAGLDIEIVPEADPTRLQPGEELPVRVLWHGKPAAGLLVHAHGFDGKTTKESPSARTGADGRARVRIGHAGQWRLNAVAMERTSGEADWRSYWASLTFELR